MRMFYSDDVGKKLYQQTIEYKVLIQQSVLASNRMEADNLFLNGGGINHDEINNSVTHQTHGVETEYVTAAFNQITVDLDYLGTVVEKDDEVQLDMFMDENQEAA